MEQSDRLNRRDFVAGVVGAGLALSLSAQQPSPEHAQTLTQKFAGIQMGPHSMLDEGIDRVLDRLQQEAGLNAVMVYTHTYYTADGIRRKRTPAVLAPDHGVPVRDLNARNLPYVWVRHHEEFFKDTVLRHMPVDSRQEYASHDLFAEMAEPVRKRGMKLYGRILEPYTADMAALMPNWSRVLTIDAWGRPGRVPCFYNPDYRNFWIGTVEDVFKNYSLDGFQFGGERVGPLSELIMHGAAPYCFCEHCRARGREKGIDVERARAGMQSLHQFIREDLLQKNAVPPDGVVTTAMRHFFVYPEILAWERLWREGKEGFFERAFGTIKSIQRTADVGEHVDQPCTTYDLFYRAEMSYAEYAPNMDFIKPILYHDIAGPRTRSMFLAPLGRTLLRELSAEQSLDLFYTLKGYDKEREPALGELDKRGLGPDYVYRETKRCVDIVAGRAKIYSGIGIDIPANNRTFPSEPEGVYQALHRAFDAGAAGVLISREYDEMRLPNLRAVGRAMAEIGKA